MSASTDSSGCPHSASLPSWSRAGRVRRAAHGTKSGVTGRQLPNEIFPGGITADEYLLRGDERDRSQHHLTQLIRHAKHARDHDREIAGLLIAAHHAAHLPIPDLVVTPPPHRGKIDRLSDIRDRVAHALTAHALQTPLREAAHIAGYRAMTIDQRRAATSALPHGRYAVTDPARVRGRLVLVLDDVVTSGQQACSMRDALHASGALAVQFVALAHAPSLRPIAPGARRGRSPSWSRRPGLTALAAGTCAPLERRSELAAAARSARCIQVPSVALARIPPRSNAVERPVA